MVFDRRANEAFIEGNGECTGYAVRFARITQPAVGEVAAVFIKGKTAQGDLIQNDVHGRCFGCDGEVDLNLLPIKCRAFKADFRLRGQRKTEKQRRKQRKHVLFHGKNLLYPYRREEARKSFVQNRKP